MGLPTDSGKPLETTGLDPISTFGSLDNTTRANVIGTIVGHPGGAPSKKELEYYHPSVAPSTLTGHLNELESTGSSSRPSAGERGSRKGLPIDSSD